MPLHRKIEEARSELSDEAALRATLERLVADGAVPVQHAAEIREAIPEQLATARYVLRHVGAHLAIGVIFAFDWVPLPLGTISRVTWVAVNRVVETVRGRHERARVHSLGVLLVAAIPWLGYAAYLLPLRQRSPELAFLIANQTWSSRTGRSYERFLAESSPLVRRFGRRIVPGLDGGGAEAASLR